MSEQASAFPVDEAVRSGGRPNRSWAELIRPRTILPATLVLLVVAMAVAPGAFAGWFGHGDPRQCVLSNSGLGPRPGHPFGFDMQGCDLYSNVIYGARPSVSIGVLVTLGMLLIGVFLGSLAGYFGGRVDAVISRVTDVFFGFPALVGSIILLQVMDSHTVLTVSAVLTVFWWPVPTRIMRSSVLAIRGLDYVEAARGLGAGHLRIILTHAVPNAVAPVLVLVTVYLGAIISTEAALTFLGIGLELPAISWGVQLNTAQQYFSSHLHLLIFPSLFLSVTVLSLVLLGDALRDVFDPRTE